MTKSMRTSALTGKEQITLQNGIYPRRIPIFNMNLAWSDLDLKLSRRCQRYLSSCIEVHLGLLSNSHDGIMSGFYHLPRCPPILTFLY